MATEHILTRGYDTIRIVHDGCDIVTGEGEHAVTQTFDDDDDARSHLEYVLRRMRRDGYGVATRTIVLEDPARDVHDGLFEWDGEHHRLRCVFADDDGVRVRCEALAAVAGAREAVGLHFVCDPAIPGPALSAALAQPLPKIRSFIFDNPFQTITRQYANSPGRLDQVLQALPALESAYVTGAAELQPCRHLRLKHLHLLGDPLSPAALAGLAGCDFPALERLVLCLSRDAEPAPVAAVVRALRGLRAPSLHHIYISGSDDLVALVDELCDRELPAPWTILSLEGILRDEDDLLAVLEARAASLGRLGRLALPLVDDLSDDAAERALALVPRLIDRDELPDQLLPSVYEEW